MKHIWFQRKIVSFLSLTGFIPLNKTLPYAGGVLFFVRGVVTFSTRKIFLPQGLCEKPDLFSRFLL